MDFQNPSRAQIVLHEIAYALMGGFYRRYAQSLGLRGDERVLEIGSGGGALSEHLLGHLTAGGSLTCVDTSAVWMDRARRRLARFDNVEFLCMDLAEAPIPDGSHDLAVIHLMLHDVPAQARPGLVSALVSKLTPTGRVAIREPIGRSHFIAESEIRELLTATGLHETSSNHSRNIMRIEMYEGVFGRQGA